MTLALLASQVTAQDPPPHVEISKWQVFQHVREARERIGATDRALAILNALLSFHPETMLSTKTKLIVWPSNEQLTARANGMSLATLRRHLAVLTTCGLIIRRDSPNGKRFARKGDGGAVVQAYGFDLTPLLTRAGEFRLLAEAILDEKRALKTLRERVTLTRRDIVKLIAVGKDEAVSYDWDAAETRYHSIMADLPRKASTQSLETIASNLSALRSDISKVLKSFINAPEMSGNESQIETHIQESKPDHLFDSQKHIGKKIERTSSPEITSARRTAEKPPLPLSLVLDACSSLRELAGGREIRHWRDFEATTSIVRTILQITPNTWSDACAVLGAQQAAIALGAIYQRSDRIRNPGGYLRTLSRRAQRGEFSALPMIMALQKNKPTPETGSRQLESPTMPGVSELANEIPVSDALLRSLAKPKRYSHALQPTRSFLAS